MDPNTCKVATVELLVGDRRASNFIRSAGLGISGVGLAERFRITYKPGEEVDEARVMKALDALIEGADAENLDVVFTSPKVIEIRDEPVGGDE